jgi:hypothetical protein
MKWYTVPPAVGRRQILKIVWLATSVYCDAVITLSHGSVLSLLAAWMVFSSPQPPNSLSSKNVMNTDPERIIGSLEGVRKKRPVGIHPPRRELMR